VVDVHKRWCTRWIGAIGLFWVGVLGCQSDVQGDGWEQSFDAGGTPETGVDLDRPPDCGDDAVEGDEVCDGDDLAGVTCANFGYDGGDLRCNDACAGFLVSECRGIPDWPTTGIFEGTSPNPCEQCGPEEVCVDGDCRAGICGDDVPPRRIDQTWQLPVGKVTGEVSLVSGDSLQPEARITVSFVNRELNFATDTRWRAGEGQSFEVELFEGDYEIWVQIRGDGWPDYPLKRQTISVEGKESVDVSVPSPVTVDASVSVNTGEHPTTGRLSIAPSDAEMPGVLKESWPEASTKEWPGSHEFRLYGGVPHDVRFRPAYSDLYDDRISAGASETPPTVISSSVRAETGGTVDVELEYETIELSTSASGAEIPDGYGVQWRVTAASSDGTVGDRKPVAKWTGRETTLPLAAGKYHIEARLLDNKRRSETVATKSILVDAPGAKDVTFDLSPNGPPVRVTGSVSGLPRDREGDIAGPPALLFETDDGRVAVRRRLEKTEPAPLDVELLPGTYDVYLEGPVASLTGVVDPSYQKLASDVRVVPDEDPMDLQLQAERDPPAGGDVRITGRVTIDGHPPREIFDLEERAKNLREESCYGSIRFRCLAYPCPKDTEYEQRYTLDRDGTYQVTLPAGRYRVLYRAPTAGIGPCNVVEPVNRPLLGEHYVLEPDLRIRRTQRRDFDMKVVRVDGTLTVDGRTPIAADPDRDHSSGKLDQSWVIASRPFEFSGHCNYSCAGELRLSTPLKEGDGAARFGFLAFPGHYWFGTDLPAYLGRERLSEVVRAEALADGRVQLDLSLRSTRVSGRITFADREPDSEDRDRQHIQLRTPHTRKLLQVDDTGRFDGRILGRDPHVVFYGDHHRSRGPSGRMVLRERCDRRLSR